MPSHSDQWLPPSPSWSRAPPTTISLSTEASQHTTPRLSWRTSGAPASHMPPLPRPLMESKTPTTTRDKMGKMATTMAISNDTTTMIITLGKEQEINLCSLILISMRPFFFAENPLACKSLPMSRQNVKVVLMGGSRCS